MTKILTTALLTGLLIAGLWAQQPTDIRIPADLISFYDRTTATGCPTGFAELTAARGAYLVGLTNSGTKGTLVGSALSDQENRSHTHTIAHTHSFSATTSGPSATLKAEDGTEGVGNFVHTHSFSGTTSAESTANSGTQSTTIAPYLQLLMCKKS